MLEDYFPSLIKVSMDELVDLFEDILFKDYYEKELASTESENLEYFWFLIEAIMEGNLEEQLNVSRQRASQIFIKKFPKLSSKGGYKTRILDILGICYCKVCATCYRKDKYIKRSEFICFECLKKYNRALPTYIRKNLKDRGLKKCTVCGKIKEIKDYYIGKDGSLPGECKKCNNERSRQWQKENPEKMSSISAKYRSSKLQRTPKWMTTEEAKEIVLFYIERPESYHVDHIIPLQGDNVSGFHCLSNLQYLPASDNFSKRNKYTPKIEVKGIDY